MSDTTSNGASHNLGRQEFGNPDNAGSHPTREQAIALMTDWVRNPRLQLHMLQVGAVLRAWAAERLGLDDREQEMWEVTGILHDADWDQWPDEHCRRIIEHLEPDTDPMVLHAIASHSPPFFGVEPVSELDHMLYAFDELSGFIHAVSLVRPEAYQGMKVKSVKKKLKEKSFAAQVNREDIADASSRIEPELDELIQFVIDHQSAVTLPE
jgi:predicted hydrolase (HD superfamily)